MITIALVISLSGRVRVVKQSDGAQFVAHSHYGSPVDLADLRYFISL